MEYKRRLEECIEKIKYCDTLSDKNKGLIVKFHHDCFAEGLSACRIYFYMHKLMNIVEWCGNKDLDSLSKDDVKSLVAKIEQMDYSEGTKHNYKVTLKKFYRWLEDSEEYPERVRWIKTTMKNNSRKLPEDILNQKEVMLLIETAEHVRDKALIATLYESGCRISEFLGLKIKNVEFDQYGSIIRVNGKTGSRRIRLISSVPYLFTWLDSHPKRDDPNSYLWLSIGTTNHNGLLSTNNIRKLLKRVALKVKISKKVNPHAFRHARATHLANKLTEAQMKEFFGWSQRSHMASIYVHLSGRDVDEAILKLSGLKVDEKNENKEEFKLKECQRCSNRNSPTSRFCNKCGLPVDIETTMKVMKSEEELLKLLNDPKILRILLEKMKYYKIDSK